MKQSLLRLEIQKIKDGIATRDKNSISLSGFKVYSQTDEDGMIEEIFRRIGDGEKTFIEIGVGDGCENNTHYLLLKGWQGVWIDTNSNALAKIKRELSPSANSPLKMKHAHITADNALTTCKEALVTLPHYSSLDFLSVDIDSQDFYVVENLLELTPRVICVEYNAKFPPPLSLCVSPNTTLKWYGDDYFGCGLQNWHDLFQTHDYTCVGCSLSGVNAFFVQKEDAKGNFSELSIHELYQPARYELIELQSGHQPTLSFLKQTISKIR